MVGGVVKVVLRIAVSGSKLVAAVHLKGAVARYRSCGIKAHEGSEQVGVVSGFSQYQYFFNRLFIRGEVNANGI